MAEEPRIKDPEKTEVRPRLVWGGGVVPAILGACAAGVGMMLGDTWLAWGGGVVVLVALVIAWRGGIMYNTRGQEPPHHEVQEFIHGGEHEGISSDARTIGEGPQAKAASVTQRKRDILARARAAQSAPRLLGAIGLIVVGGWLLFGQWIVNYPLTAAGQDSALRDLGFGVIIVLCALRLRMPTRSRLASALCLLGGGLLILSGLFLAHDSYFVRLDEIVAGAAVLGFSGLTFS